MGKDVGTFCSWFFIFCGNHGDPCKKRDQKDGFGCGDSYPNSGGATVFLADGPDHRNLVRDNKSLDIV